MKYFFSLLLLCFAFVSHGIPDDLAPDDCASADACLEKLYAVVDRTVTPGQYPPLPEQAILKKMLQMEEDALPLLVNLLDESDSLMARLGAVALRAADRIDSKYLPQIISGLEKDVSWLAPALVGIGTPEAAELAVKFYLRSSSAPYNQEAIAVRRFGRQAFPAIRQALLCDFGCDDHTHYLLGKVLSDLETEQKTEAATLLMTLVMGSITTEAVKKELLHIISKLGVAGLIVEADLLTLRDTTPGLLKEINHALIGIQSAQAAKIFAELLVDRANLYLFEDLAELGSRGYEAGTEVMRWLDSEERIVKLLAARTLGFIQYTPAAAKLTQMLADTTDVQLAWVLAESLALLGDDNAIPVLKKISTQHWYPPVQEAASRAINQLSIVMTDDAISATPPPRSTFLNYQYFGVEACKQTMFTRQTEPKSQKLYADYAAAQLQDLATAISIKRTRTDNATTRSDQHTPDLALRVPDGWLTGANRGEWGGELVHVTDEGVATPLLDKNVEDIYRLGDRYIALVGLAHMYRNDGNVYILTSQNEGQWQAQHWITLPGAPSSSWFVETGEILINTVGGGTILLSLSGAMRVAECL